MYVLVLAEGEGIAESVIFCLRQCGINSLVIGPESGKALVLTKGCQKYFPFKNGAYISSPMKIINLINSVAYNFNPSIIVPTDSDSTMLLSSYKDHISIPLFPVPSRDIFDCLNNKWYFFQLLKRIGLPQPKTFLLEDVSALNKFELKFPLVSKQLCGRSGEDIYYFNNEDNLFNFLKGCEKKLLPMILQEYIPGYDIDLSVLSINGQIMAWSIQKWKEKGILQFINEPDILSLGQQLIHEIQYTGVAHFDLRYDNRDRAFKFIECNPRFWGSLKASYCCGVNFPCIGLQQVLYLLPKNSLKQYPPQDAFWMTFRGLLRSFKSRESFREITVDALKYSFNEIAELWFLNQQVEKFSPKTSQMLVSLYDKFCKKIDNHKSSFAQ